MQKIRWPIILTEVTPVNVQMMKIGSLSMSQGQADLLKHAKSEAMDTLRQIHYAAHSCGLAKNGASTSPASPLLPPYPRLLGALHTIPETDYHSTDTNTLHWYIDIYIQYTPSERQRERERGRERDRTGDLGKVGTKQWLQGHRDRGSKKR